MRLSLEQQIRNSIDNSLRHTAASMTDALNSPSAQDSAVSFGAYKDTIQALLISFSYRDSAPGQFEQVELVEPPSAGGQSALLGSGGSGVFVYPDVLYKVVSNNQPQFVDFKDQSLRGYVEPLTVPAPLRQQGVTGALEVFQQEHNYVEIQNRLDLILSFGIPIVLVVALFLGWWVARAALRPIERISRTVRSIGGSQDLRRRLNFVGPRDEVGRLADTFDDMMERLEGAFETQKRFVADASHELRTPLTAIKGNAELFSLAPPEERDQCVAAIRREAERMSRLVADLLLLAAADIEQQPVHKQRTDLRDLLTDVYRSALLMAGDKVTVALDAPESIVVNADPDRIKQLVLNLVDNAVKFTPHDGCVEISAEAGRSEAFIHVTDTGVGIPPDDQAAIFRRFYRVEASRSTRGSGLGLSICQWIAQAHGGRLDVQSTPGLGSRFTLCLPRDDEVAAPEYSASGRAVTSQVQSDPD